MPNPVDLNRIRAIRPYAVGEAQEKHLDAVLEAGTIRKAAKKLGMNHSTIQRTIDSASTKMARVQRGEHLDSTAAPGYAIKRTSTLFGRDGEGVTQQWVILERDAETMHRLREEAVAAMGESIPKAKPVPAPKKSKWADGKLNQFTITDYHLGMYSWPDETGDKWNTEEAERLLVAWFSRAIQTAPDAETAVLAQLGDFLHWDGMDAVTPQNKHLLDADSRFALVVRTAIRVLRQVVELLLSTHQHVHIIMAEGNHDPASSIWLREWFSVLYEKEPRVTVDTSPSPFYCYEWGRVLLCYHHGHKVRMNDLDRALVSKFKEQFGRAKWVFAHTGHMHHEITKETSLMILEQHPTLAAKDAYAARLGLESYRDANVTTYHRDQGRIGRIYLSPEAA